VLEAVVVSHTELEGHRLLRREACSERNEMGSKGASQ